MDITDDDSPRSSSPQLEDEKRGLLASTLTTTVRSDNDDPCSIRESKKLIVRLYRAVALLSVLCFILLISSIVLAIQKQALEPKTHPSWLPPETRIKKIFEFRSLYGGEPTEQSEDAWRELIPSKLLLSLRSGCSVLIQVMHIIEGKGYVIISNDTAIPEMPSLDQSVEEQHAMVSVFHQLHCLVSQGLTYHTRIWICHH